MQNRPAEELIPIVKPLLRADDAISGQGFKIFLRSSPETLARVRDLGELGISADVQIESGDITYGTSDGSVTVNGISTQENLRDNPIHHVRVTEGTEAYIETGERIPYFTALPGGDAGGLRAASNTRMR